MANNTVEIYTAMYDICEEPLKLTTDQILENLLKRDNKFKVFENARQKETRLFFDIEDVDPVSLNKFVRLCASYGDIIISGYV